MPAFRILVDVNVWIAALMGQRLGRQGTASQRIVAIATGTQLCGRPLQLVASHEQLATLERHLQRLGFRKPDVEAYVASLSEICSSGPDALDPLLVLGGAEQLAMADREDAGILAAAIAARAHLVVTDNLPDFSTGDSVAIPTQVIRRPGQADRRLEAIVHRPPGGVALLVAHPNDVLFWVRQGLAITPEVIRDLYDPDRIER